jgi:glutamate formiminotransferase/formiminotetrahydrofolate cyclodeaminase
LLQAGTHYAQQEKDRQKRSERELLALAVARLGLNQLEPFEPSKKIIEYQL